MPTYSPESNESFKFIVSRPSGTFALLTRCASTDSDSSQTDTRLRVDPDSESSILTRSLRSAFLAQTFRPSRYVSLCNSCQPHAKHHSSAVFATHRQVLPFYIVYTRRFPRKRAHFPTFEIWTRQIYYYLHHNRSGARTGNFRGCATTAPTWLRFLESFRLSQYSVLAPLRSRG